MSLKRLFFTVPHGEDGQYVADVTTITEANLAGFSSIWTRIATRLGGAKGTAYIGFWDQGAAAFDPTVSSNTFNNFPNNTIVHDFVGGFIWYRKSNGDWKKQAVAT